MKRTFASLILALLVTLGAYAGSFYTFGASGAFTLSDAGLDNGGGGLYFDSSYVYSQKGTPLSHGYGTMIDFNFPGFHRGAIMNIMVGYALEWDLNDSFSLCFLIGPSFSNDLRKPSREGISLGGGLDVNAAYFFNADRTVGINFGVKALMEAGGMGGDLRPEGALGAHLGIAIRLAPKEGSLPSHSYTAEFEPVGELAD